MSRQESLECFEGFLVASGGMLFSLILLVVVALGCSGCGLDTAWVKADRATYDVVAPAHRAYVNADPALDADAKARRFRLLDSWEARLVEAEK